MEYVGYVLSAVLAVFRLPLDIFGYTVSFWQVFIYTTVVAVVLGFVGEAFLGD